MALKGRQAERLPGARSVGLFTASLVMASLHKDKISVEERVGLNNRNRYQDRRFAPAPQNVHLTYSQSTRRAGQSDVKFVQSANSFRVVGAPRSLHGPARRPAGAGVPHRPLVGPAVRVLDLL